MISCRIRRSQASDRGYDCHLGDWFSCFAGMREQGAAQIAVGLDEGYPCKRRERGKGGGGASAGRAIRTAACRESEADGSFAASAQGAAPAGLLKRDDFSSNRHPATLLVEHD